jgi:hypothetical protein
MESHLLHKARELSDILEQTTGEPGDLLHTLQHIAQTAGKFFAADASAVFAMNPITNRFVESQISVGNVLQSNKKAFEQLRLKRRWIGFSGILAVSGMQTVET